MAAGQATEAVSWFQRVLDGRAGVLGPDHPGAISAKVSLGRAMVAVGHPDDAVAVLEEVNSRGAGSWRMRSASPRNGRSSRSWTTPGPLVKDLGGADISWIVGFFVSAIVYLVLVVSTAAETGRHDRQQVATSSRVVMAPH